MKVKNNSNLFPQIRKQAAEGDPVCAELLSLSALNHQQGGGYEWIDMQLDMEDDDDDFRPF